MPKLKATTYDIQDPVQRRAKQVARAKEHMQTDQPLFGVVVLFDVWCNERTGERALKEITRSRTVPYWDAINAYANTPNPASQLLKFRDEAEYEEVSAELALDIVDPIWLGHLFEQI